MPSTTTSSYHAEQYGFHRTLTYLRQTAAFLLAQRGTLDRLEAAFFLWMLNDPRSEPEIAAVRAASVSRRLAATPLKPINAAWIAGPFADGDKGLRAEHEPERGPIDLGKNYPVGKAAIGWT